MQNIHLCIGDVFESQVLNLIRLIVIKYVNIRCNAMGKNYTQNCVTGTFDLTEIRMFCLRIDELSVLRACLRYFQYCSICYSTEYGYLQIVLHICLFFVIIFTTL